MSSKDLKGAASGVPSIISPDLEIVGNLKSNGEIQIDGMVKGDIDGYLLTVGEQGKVDGSTVGETVRIFGTVSGRVQAKTVRLAKSAKVTADITHESLAIEAGAKFEGRVQPLRAASLAGAPAIGRGAS
ncbi:MAG: polymer-forming cytoskeletal protein [Kiloniellales bacterium]|jgi:cytoskeletal protein CcmA (bactofilin family)